MTRHSALSASPVPPRAEPSQAPAPSVANDQHAPLDEVGALHLGLCTKEAFLRFAQDFDSEKSFEASPLRFSQDFEYHPVTVSAAWESVCRHGINLPEGFAESAASVVPLRERLELLLKHDLAGTEPLHWAATNSPEVLATLVSGPLPLIAVDTPGPATGSTALMQSANAGNLESVKTLLAHGADPTLENNTGMTSLHGVCAGSADPGVTAAILEAAKQKIANRGTPQDKHQQALSDFVNQVDQNGDGALKWLFYAGSHEKSIGSAELLLQAGAKLGAVYRTGETLLHFGARTCGPQPGAGEFDARHNNMQLLGFVVSQFKRNGLSIDMKDKQGFTPLERAVQAGRVEAADLLSDHGAVWTRSNMSNWTQLKKLPANLPQGLTEISLSFCTSLESLPENLPQGLRHLDLTCCSSLESLPVNLPQGLTALYLVGCTSLKSLPENLPQGLTALNLVGCSSLKSLPENLPQGLTDLYLTDCSSLKSLPVNLPQWLTYLNLVGCTSLKSLPENLPQGLRYLDLSGCTSLKSLPENLPQGLSVWGWGERR